MAAYSPDQMQDGLRNKGFLRHDEEPLGKRQEKRVADHYLYYFHYAGKRTAIRTKISMGSKYVYDERGLLKPVASQLKLSLGQVKRLIECPMSMEEYIVVLQSRGFLRK